MSEPFQVNLTRPNQGPSWGFRLQGGTDFSTALSIQSVNPGSIAEQCGLRAGDAILQIGNRPSDELEHEQAKQEIMMCGNNVNMIVQRGQVKVWQPKVTPMSELRSGPGSVPSQGPSADNYIQKTSLAADKQQEPMKINFFNKSPRGFPGAAGSSAPSGNPSNPTVPVIMNAQYNTPMSMYSSNSAMEAFDQQSQALVGNMDGLTVTDGDTGETNNNNDSSSKTTTTTHTAPVPKSQVKIVEEDRKEDMPKRVASPTFLAVHQNDEPSRPRSQSPSFLRVLNQCGDQSGAQRSASPTLLAVQQEQSGRKSPQPESARYKDTKDGEEIRYRGYTDPSKQSKSFRLLQQGLSESEGNGQAPAAQPAAPSAGVQGMRSVRAPTGPPPNVQVQQAQHMTCKGCGSLIVGVFVRIKGDPMHPECFKCANCGKNLKNKGHFTVQGSLFCEACATTETQPPGQNMTATAVYR